jgi:hypothetical protein
MKECRGFGRGKHVVAVLHAKGLCDSCYLKMWRHENHERVIKYQKEYRADSAYKIQHCVYMAAYRKRRGE